MTIRSASFSIPEVANMNQDALCEFVVSDDKGIFAVADGMGGEKGGDIAANLAINEVKEFKDRDISEDLKVIYSSTYNKLLQTSIEQSDLKNMGTTLSVVLIDSDKVYLAHVGDSRVYHLRGSGLVTRTRDQTEVQALLDEGIITKAKAQRYPRRNVLLSVLSPSHEYNLFQNMFSIEKGDRLILLTDGIYDILTKNEISGISQDNTELEGFIKKLEEEVFSRERRDDCSIVCIEIT